MVDKILKKPKKKIRNPYTINAKRRKAGKQKPKEASRQNGVNEQQELLKEANDEI